MTSTQICCVPSCKSNSKFKHSSFYSLKPEWIKLITVYIKRRKKNSNWDPGNLQMICGRHLNLCGIRQVNPERNLVHFPYLRISVSKEKQSVVEPEKFEENEIHMWDNFGLGCEVMIPNNVEPDINLTKEKRSTKHGTCELHDHNYAVSLEYVTLLKEDYEKTKEENRTLADNIQTLTEKYEKEIQRLKEVTHDLIRSSMQTRSSRVEYPFKNIMDNERMLKFYTGFSDRKSFEHFSNLLKPEYDLARLREKKDNSRPGRKQYVEYEQQLILVLSRLRLGLLQHDLAYRFNVSTTTISGIWSFWINLLSIQLVNESVKLLSNVSNRFSHPNNRIILECNETFVENSDFLQDQSSKLSSSKRYSRAKGLIEVTATGFISFVSDIYPSDINEKELLEQCNFSESGDSSKSVSQVGYGLTKKRHGNTKENSGRIGRFTALQTHIQRILGFIKSFKILKGTFPNSMHSHVQLNSFWKICCYLINFINRPLQENIR